MGIARKTGASPIITVNYGSGTAAEAAAWVKYANVTKHYGIKYWELGNEIPGDGTYGAQWEHNIKPKGATAYANSIADYITQMKAVDPVISAGAGAHHIPEQTVLKIAQGTSGSEVVLHPVANVVGGRVERFGRPAHYWTTKAGDKPPVCRMPRQWCAMKPPTPCLVPEKVIWAEGSRLSTGSALA